MTTEEETVKKTPSGSVRKYADNILPMARIKKIMKMDPNITDQITIEANYLVCSATEIFIRKLVRDAFQANKEDKETLDYRNLAKYVQDHEDLDFLHAVLPNKITVKDYKKILAEETEKEANSESDYESSEDEGSDEEEAEEEESENDEGEENSIKND